MSFWKAWFYLAIVMCLTVALATFMSALIAFLISLVLGYFKIIKPNTYVHNLTELFIYAGLAVIFVPILDQMSMIILLILISFYDMYAVWKSKHMIKLANFQTESKVFAGFFVPYDEKSGKIVKISKVVKKSKEIKNKISKNVKINMKHKKKIKDKKTEKRKTRQVSSAILGGGDIAFPLLFAGVIMKYIIVTDFWISFLKILIIPICTTIALGYLFYYTRKNKFYPAMPFITIGCFVGYGLFLLL